VEGHGYIAPCIVDNLVQGSPAELCGKINVGDFLVNVGEEAVEFLATDEIVDMIVGPVGSDVTLTFEGADGLYEVTLTRTAPPAEDSASVSSGGSGSFSVMSQQSFVQMRRSLVKARKLNQEQSTLIETLQNQLQDSERQTLDLRNQLSSQKDLFETWKAEIGSDMKTLQIERDDLARQLEESEKDLHETGVGGFCFVNSLAR